jgi:hypothetical protein
MNSYIVCAAVKMRNKVTGDITLLIGARHWDNLMHAQRGFMSSDWIEDRSDGPMTSQGFVDQFGNYLTRKEACAIAKSHNQVRFTGPGFEAEDILFSENLY